MNRKAEVWWYVIGAILAIALLIVMMVAGVVRIPKGFDTLEKVGSKYYACVCNTEGYVCGGKGESKSLPRDCNGWDDCGGNCAKPK